VSALVYVAPLPVCPVHGQMHYQPGAGPGDDPLRCCLTGACEPDPSTYHRQDRWICQGWDGEGCDAGPDARPWQLTAEDALWQPIGTADDIKFTFTASPERP
jgi:hypothetical protein